MGQDLITLLSPRLRQSTGAFPAVSREWTIVGKRASIRLRSWTRPVRRAVLSVGLFFITPASAAPPYSPYRDAGADAVYHRLFCDDVSVIRAVPGEKAEPWQVLLGARKPDLAALRKVATDARQEGRARALAFHRLRALGREVPRRILLGVITEVSLPEGLDTLAAYTEGSVSYINHTGRMLFVEGGVAQTRDIVPRLFSAAQGAVDRLEPSRGVRRPPPEKGNVRFTFVTSDGPYVGEGPMSAMQQDPLGGAILGAATELLVSVVRLGVR